MVEFAKKQVSLDQIRKGMAELGFLDVLSNNEDLLRPYFVYTIKLFLHSFKNNESICLSMACMRNYGITEETGEVKDDPEQAEQMKMVNISFKYS